jgi:hypothetical protein
MAGLFSRVLPPSTEPQLIVLSWLNCPELLSPQHLLMGAIPQDRAAMIFSDSDVARVFVGPQIDRGECKHRGPGAVTDLGSMILSELTCEASKLTLSS